MDRFSFIGKKYARVCCCPKRRVDEQPVRPDLSRTPAQMMALVEQGIPVSVPNAISAENQGVLNPSWDVPIERKRGTDIADIWQKQQASRKKLADAREAIKKAKLDKSAASVD